MTFKKEIRTYIREIRSLLFVRTKETRRFVRDMEASITDFVEENDVRDIKAVHEQFGTPEEIAKAFFAKMPLSDVKRRVRLKRIVAAVLLAAFLVWAVYLTILFVEGLKEVNGYGVESGPMTDEELSVLDPHLYQVIHATEGEMEP